MLETRRVRAEIDLDAARFNMISMHKNLKEGTKMAAVIKTDAYGHGASRIAGAIQDLPFLWGYAVATVDEGLQLIKDGIKKPILVLGICFEDQYQSVVEEEIRPAVCDYSVAEALSREAVKQDRICRIHIKIDTGMSRIGFLVNDENAGTIARIAKLPGIEIEGIFTHFARADELDKEPAHEQMTAFVNMINKIEEKGLKIPIHHCSNSAGIVEIPEANMDMVRAGITLYGMWPSEEVQKDIIRLKPVMSLKSHVTFVKELEAGTAVSYGGTFVTDRKTVLATIPVGYGDGYCRGLSNKGYVLIHGKKAPICGRVCMDQFMVDVTDIPDVRVGTLVTLLGKDKEAEITMEELGRLSGRFNYEFSCLITPRVPRVYIHNPGTVG